MKVLIGCPTSFHKEYCLNEYSKIVKELNHDVLLVDNSPNDDYFNKIKKLNLNVIKGPYFEGALNRITKQALKELEKDGWIIPTKKTGEVHYSLNPRKIDEILQFYENYCKLNQ